MDVLTLLRGAPYKINDQITIKHPTVGEIAKYGEEKYWGMVSTLTAVPYDYKLQLYDVGIDYEEISDFDLFCIIVPTLQQSDTEILFGDAIDFSTFQLMVKNGKDIVFRDDVNNIDIDSVIYELIAQQVRDMHGFTKNLKKAGNARTKQFLIDEDRANLERNQGRPYESMLEPLVSALVNCADFKYNYETIWELPIYSFMDSVKRTQKISNYRNLMTGIYTGNVDSSKISEKQLNWLGKA